MHLYFVIMIHICIYIHIFTHAYLDTIISYIWLFKLVLFKYMRYPCVLVLFM